MLMLPTMVVTIRRDLRVPAPALIGPWPTSRVSGSTSSCGRSCEYLKLNPCCSPFSESLHRYEQLLHKARADSQALQAENALLKAELASASEEREVAGGAAAGGAAHAKRGWGSGASGDGAQSRSHLVKGGGKMSNSEAKAAKAAEKATSAVTPRDSGAPMVCEKVGTFEGLYRQRNATPRQGGLTPNSLGQIGVITHGSLLLIP